MDFNMVKVRGGRYINVCDVESFERVTLENTRFGVFRVIASVFRGGSYFYVKLRNNKDRIMITYSDYEQISSILYSRAEGPRALLTKSRQE